MVQARYGWTDVEVDAICFERLVQILDTILHAKAEEAKVRWQQAAFPAFVAYLIGSTKEERKKNGFSTFPEFLEGFGLEAPPSDDVTKEEKADEIAEAYSTQRRVFAAFERAGIALPPGVIPEGAGMGPGAPE